MEQRQPARPPLPWVLGGLEDHANMFLERERMKPEKSGKPGQF